MLAHRLWLQRRRHYVVTLLLYLAGLAGFGSMAEDAGAAHLFALAGALALGGLMLTAALLALAPALRRCCETLAMATLCVALFPVDVSLAPHDPLAQALLTVSVAMVLYVALYGGWWSRVPFRFDWTTRRRFVAHCPPQAVWARLVPDPANPAAHYSGLFLSQEPVADHPDRVLQRTQTEEGVVIETLLDIEAQHPPHQISYAYHSPLEHADYKRGRFRLTITPLGKKSFVCFAETVESLTLPTALDLWFDDFGGEVRSSMQSALNDRAERSFWNRLRATPRPAGTN
jgi:hypothetical protein